MPDKPHLSSTQLDMYLRCPESWRRRYLEHEIIPPGIALITGKALHAGAEVNFRQKIDSHEDLPTDKIIDAAAAAFDTEKAGGYALSDEENGRGAAAVLGEAKDMAVKLAGAYAEHQAPDYQPIAVEHKTLIEFPSASHDLLAFTDLRDDLGRVVDFKTAARKKSNNEAHDSTQLTIYAAAYMVDHGQPPTEVRLDVLTKTKVPGRQVLRSARDRRDFTALVNRVNVVLRGIEAGIFPPAPMGAWQCSPRWCGYWSTCPYVNSERRAAAEGAES